MRSAIIEALYPTSANILPAVCEGLGLASGDRDKAFASKRNYVQGRISGLSRDRLLQVAHQLLQDGPNFELEEAVARVEEASERLMSDLLRRAIGRALIPFDLSGHIPLNEFLRDVWPIDRLPSRLNHGETVQDDLDRHMHRNADMDNEDALEAVGAYSGSQRRFFRFLEALIHPRTREEDEQRRLVAILNPLLQRDGFHLAETGSVSGYPVFTIKAIGGSAEAPADPLISEVLAAFDEASVHEAWTRALQRRATHPEGAITLARTLLETVCKHIIEEAGGTYSDRDELPKLYRTAAEHLQLAPDQHTEEVFKTILGNCQNVVNSLASIRNKLSDAHGRGRKAVRPAARHAELAVNLAGTVATFLVSTWRARQAAKL
ncbi:abortive infection family protein [Azospirillum agricola]|uniref:abortive infection family protein n=1 Tax=Azospirillum agricola TaxID=1720247 RepID=UPI001CC0F268|nr:abortive infection family protein [Azospirillum agricola]